jgi:hypothetical protein
MLLHLIKLLYHHVHGFEALDQTRGPNRPPHICGNMAFSKRRFETILILKIKNKNEI